MVDPIDMNCADFSSRALPPLPCPQMQGVKVLLASNSPRRRELLGLILPEFTIAESRDVDESYPSGLKADEVPVVISQKKAAAYADMLCTGELIITADTVVVLGNEILGKPRDHADACAMLAKLAGNTHTVITGVTLTTDSRSTSFAENTKVTFATMTADEIEQYVRLYRPFDKAGAYGIQEWIGAAVIERIDGCFYNVMGLPLHRLYRVLRQFFDGDIV